jgi:hypothetical protein
MPWIASKSPPAARPATRANAKASSTARLNSATIGSIRPPLLQQNQIVRLDRLTLPCHADNCHIGRGTPSAVTLINLF